MQGLEDCIPKPFQLFWSLGPKKVLQKKHNRHPPTYHASRTQLEKREMVLHPYGGSHDRSPDQLMTGARWKSEDVIHV